MRVSRHSGRGPPNQPSPGVVAGLLSFTAGGCRSASQRHASRDKKRLAGGCEARGKRGRGRGTRQGAAGEFHHAQHMSLPLSASSQSRPVLYVHTMHMVRAGRGFGHRAPVSGPFSRPLTSIACSRSWVGTGAPSRFTWHTTIRPNGSGAGSSAPSVSLAWLSPTRQTCCEGQDPQGPSSGQESIQGGVFPPWTP